MIIAGIYRISDAASGRFYVGSSVNTARRWIQHQQRLKNGNHPNPRLQAIWNIDPSRLLFQVFQTAESPGRDVLLELEQRALDDAGVGANPLCMNVLAIAGSHLGRKRSEDTKARMAASQRGRTASAETRAKQRAAKLGKPQSIAVRQAQSERSRGKKLGPRGTNKKPRSDRSLTDEQVRALRRRRAEGLSWRLLGIEFGLHQSAAKRCALGISYKAVA